MRKAMILLVALALSLFMAPGARADLTPYIWVDVGTGPWAGGNLIPDTGVTLQPSEVVWLNVYAGGIPVGGPGLMSAGLLANYNPQQLEITPGTAMAFPPWMLGQVTWNNPGVIDFVGGNLGPPFAMTGNQIPLITIELHCMAPGVSQLLLGEHLGAFSDFVLVGGAVLDQNMVFPLAFTVTNVVPIPGTLLLFGSGLLGLVAVGRRRLKR